MQVSWNEAASACDRMYSRFHKTGINDYTALCCNSALPTALKNMLVVAIVNRVSYDDPDVVIMINAYQQLDKQGFIKS